MKLIAAILQHIILNFLSNQPVAYVARMAFYNGVQNKDWIELKDKVTSALLNKQEPSELTLRIHINDLMPRVISRTLSSATLQTDQDLDILLDDNTEVKVNVKYDRLSGWFSVTSPYFNEILNKARQLAAS